MIAKSNYDKGLENLKEIKNVFSEFCNSTGKVTEADTRRLVIDRILIEVLFWPTSKIKCEEHLKAEGAMYIDYIYKYDNKNSIIVEAKKEGISFDLPQTIATTRLKLNSLLKESKSELSRAIEQTWSYCANNGSDFGITTNGYSWIIFKAITSGERWREREAIVFKSLEDIIDKFQLFWDLLSVDSINNFSLEKQLPSVTLSERETLLNELSEDFNMDKYLSSDRFIERVRKYDGKEIPIAKPELISQGYCDVTEKFYFKGDRLSWLQPQHKNNNIVRLSTNNLFLEIDRIKANDLFEDRENYELYATLIVKEDYIYFSKPRLKHIYNDESYIVGGVLNPYYTKMIEICKAPIVSASLNSQLKKLNIIDEKGNLYLYNYNNDLMEKEIQIPIREDQRIVYSRISDDGRNIIVVLEDKSLHFFVFNDDILVELNLNKIPDEIADIILIGDNKAAISCMDSFGFFDFTTEKYTPIIKSKKKILSLFFYQYFDIYINTYENIIGLNSKEGIIIIDIKTMSEIMKINDWKIDSKKIEKIIYASSKYIILKYKRNKYLYKIIFSKDEIKIEKFDFIFVEYIKNSVEINNCNYLALAFRGDSYMSDREPVFRLEIIDTMNMDRFGTCLHTVESPVNQLIYSNYDGVLFSHHANGNICMWEVIIKSKDRCVNTHSEVNN